MKIKKATVDDAEVLAGLCSEIQALHIKMQPLIFRETSHQELVDFFRERISNPDYMAFWAFDADQPVGYIVLHILEKPGNIFVHARNILEIDHIHIVERYRRQGVCKKLFSKALDVAVSLRIENIQLGVWSRNDRAIAAFHALGFKQQYHVMAFEDKTKLNLSDAADSPGGAAVPD